VIRLAGCLGFLWCAGMALAHPAESDSSGIELFERKIRPLLVEHCYECHSSQAPVVHGELRLDTSAAFRQGGASGPVLAEQAVDSSLLLEVLSYAGDIQMPPDGKLAAADIAAITAWMRMGAPLPTDFDTPSTSAKPAAIDWPSARQFWSFRPAEIQPLPAVQDSLWPETRTDRFVLAAMEQANLSPAPPAARNVLVRRLYFDVLGVAPTPEQVEEFVEDGTYDAYERLVDRLLQSPHYGERWGRMWLDLARYTDATASWLEAAGQPHLYRDWVVQAFNSGVPYDDFIHRQLATDLMPDTGPDDLPALGFISLSPTYWKELKLPCEIINTIVADEWEERVGAATQTFLGLTVACARCHDHKFDPISTEDYYALAGVFASCRQTELPTIDSSVYAPVQQAKQEIAALELQIAALKKQKPVDDPQLEMLTNKIAELKLTPLFNTPMASVVTEEALYVERAGASPQDGTRLEYRPGPRDLPVYLRGDPNRPGEMVPRRFLQVLARNSDRAGEPIPFSQGSGRLELAQAITTESAALTARVMVNRVWLALFGRGLVTTPSNFGQQGDAPTHPKLLDDLAARFIANNWSLRSLQRELLLSATYRQSSAYEPSKTLNDPENRWLSRMNRRRLDFEGWRDSILHATGQLNWELGGPSLDLEAAGNHRRTLYATIHRHEMSATMLMHDFPDPNQHSPARSTTVTPLQGLYALNGPLLSEQANQLAVRLRREASGDDRAKIALAYQLLFARAPIKSEMSLGLEFLSAGPPSSADERWEQYAQVLLASNELIFID
jgi:hypothetical protein